MKAKRLIIKNIGLIADETIEIDKPLILFYGDIRQGKTTILNSVKWLFGGSYPDDIIRHGEKEASVKMLFDNGSIGREWYIAKDGKVSDRPIIFVIDGQPVKSPVKEIAKFLNPFLLDQDYFRKKGEVERGRYLVELFGVDTKEIDKKIAAAADEAKTLRATIKGYGAIDITEVVKVDVDALKGKRGAIIISHDEAMQKVRGELAEIRKVHLEAVRDIEKENNEIRGHNSEVALKEQSVVGYNRRLDEIEQEITRLTSEKNDIGLKKVTLNQWLTDNPKRDEKQLPPPPDTSALEAKLSEQADTKIIDEEISQAAATNVRYEQYQTNLARKKQRDAEEKKLLDLEALQRELKKQKTASLKGISDTCGIPTLSFDDDGNFMYQETTAGMLSTSQIMKLSSELSALYPAGFGLDLIDRGESLGKSIFEYVDRAQKEEKTILATIVGERPAVVPENIGVFVVENGRVTE